ncbi:MAG: YceI family protein [Dehalococcoidia bacterium]
MSTWSIDPAHSSAEFAVKHMMVTTVKGRFNIAEGTLRIDEGDPSRSSVRAAIDVASVDTGVADRDAHLRSDDFFNAEQYPRFTFETTRLERVDDERWRMTGDLTMRDVTRPVALDVEFEGRGIDAYGKDRAGFVATAKINRKDFGVSWNGAIETGGVVVSDSVKITLNIAAIRQD